MPRKTIPLYSYRFGADFNLQIVFVNPRNFGNDDHLFRGLIHIHRRLPGTLGEREGKPQGLRLPGLIEHRIAVMARKRRRLEEFEKQAAIKLR